MAELGIGIEIDGIPWRQVPHLASSGSDDRHYVVRPGSDGPTLVEFGDGVHGQAPSSRRAIGVRYRAGARYSSVLLQQGRVVIDTDGGEAAPVIACGIYRETVVENADPLVRDDRNCLPQRSPGAPGTWPNRLAGMYPDDEIARRLNVSTRTVHRHRTRNQPPAYSAVTSADPTRHASAITITNAISRQSQRGAADRCEWSSHHWQIR